MKYWRIRKTSKALAKNVGTSSGSQVPTQPSFRKIVYVGMMVTAAGQEDRRDEQREQERPAGEPEARESVRHERAREQRPDRRR